MRPELIDRDITAECMLSPTVDAALAVRRSTALFLSVMEDHWPDISDLYLQMLAHVCRRMAEQQSICLFLSNKEIK